MSGKARVYRALAWLVIGAWLCSALVVAGLGNAQARVLAQATPNLRISSVCSDDPGMLRRWDIANLDASDISVDWVIVGSGQRGTVTVPGYFAARLATVTVLAGSNRLILLVGGAEVAAADSTDAPCNPVPLGGPDKEAKLSVRKDVCESIGQQTTCNGLDDSLANTVVSFKVYEGPNASGPVFDIFPVKLDLASGSAGRTTHGGFASRGTYTVDITGEIGRVMEAMRRP
jgi:hypothetical protein